MTFGEYLSDRLGRISIILICAAVSALFLTATGTQPGVVAILFLTLFLVFAAVLLSDFLRQRSRLQEWEDIIDGLDQKYLFTECAPPPSGLYERRLFDLTRQAGRAMVATVSDARAASREYQEYVERWIHEVKTPITAARLTCRRLDADSRRKLDYELGRIEAHVERALFYARAQSPEQDCVIRRTDMNQIVTQAIANHRSLLIQSGVRVETEGLSCFVYTDEKWAVFLLGQLLQNAARYRGKTPLIRIAAHPLGRQTQLTVQDNGIGIPAHELPRIFDRGFTGSNGHTKSSSTGMGLYLCKKLAGFLALDLQVTSREGEGTCVTLTFPSKESLS